MLRKLGFLLLFALAFPLAALQIDPPAPDSRTFIRVETLDSPCPIYTGSNVVIDGSTITVTPVVAPAPPGSGCGANLVPRWVDVGVIKPGVYTIAVPGPGQTDSAPLIVRDADSGILVSPVGGPMEGKRSVQVFGARSGDTILFDGIPLPIQQFARDYAVVTPPPHAPGTVDVTVIGETVTRKAVAAYTYFDPAAAPDPFVFEPLLFPVAYDGAGEFDSEWRTENRMAAGETLVRFRRPVPAKACSGDCNGFNWSGVLAGQSQSGQLIWVVRRRIPLGIADDFRVASRITETSRLNSAGTSLPVAREKDFRRRGTVTFDGVPVGGNRRVTLRIYSLSEGVASVRVAQPSGAFTTRVVDLRLINGVAFASVDLAPFPRPDVETVAVSGNGIWALITITDNSSQEVTALWPQ